MAIRLSVKKKINQTISLYYQFGWKKYFARLRFWYAPFYEVEKLLPKKGTILDLGCAEGVLASYTAISSPQRDVIGIEMDKARLQQAPKIIHNLKFQEGDITKIQLPKADAIIIFHVLHHLPSYTSQVDVLKKCLGSLNPKGKLIIVEVNVKPSIKYFTTWFTDHFLVAWFFEKRIYSPILFRKKLAWEKLLSELGFSTDATLSEKRGPFANIILECFPKAKIGMS